mgnify:FL=1
MARLFTVVSLLDASIHRMLPPLVARRAALGGSSTPDSGEYSGGYDRQQGGNTINRAMTNRAMTSATRACES